MNTRKKEMMTVYKDRELIGGVYVIKNTQSGRKFLDATTDIRGSRNRFDFAQKNNMCVHKRIEDDWKKSGAGVFVFEVIEELPKDASQSMEIFQADVATLKELWLEKLAGEDVFS